eukprot:1121772-Rhodomonas_salina.1
MGHRVMATMDVSTMTASTTHIRMPISNVACKSQRIHISSGSPRDGDDGRQHNDGVKHVPAVFKKRLPPIRERVDEELEAKEAQEPYVQVPDRAVGA